MDEAGEDIVDDFVIWYQAQVKTTCGGIPDSLVNKYRMEPGVSIVGRQDTGKGVVIKERRKKLQEGHHQIQRTLPF